MKNPTATVFGKREKLSISIDQESVNIYIDRGDTKEPVHICYWHIEEVEEDASVAISMVNAVHLFYTNPQDLINKLGLK